MTDSESDDDRRQSSSSRQTSTSGSKGDWKGKTLRNYRHSWKSAQAMTEQEAEDCLKAHTVKVFNVLQPTAGNFSPWHTGLMSASRTKGCWMAFLRHFLIQQWMLQQCSCSWHHCQPISRRLHRAFLLLVKLTSTYSPSFKAGTTRRQTSSGRRRWLMA